MKTTNLIISLCVVLMVLFAGCGNNEILPEATSAALSGGETVVQPPTIQPTEASPVIEPTETSPDNEPTEDMPEETRGSIELVPVEPPTMLEFDSLDEFERMVTAARGTEAEFLAAVGNSDFGWDKNQAEMLYLYEKFSELPLPGFATEQTSVMYFPDTDTLDIMYRMGDTCYRFLFSEARGDEKVPEGKPVATDVRFGPYTVDLVPAEPGGAFDYRVGGGTVKEGIRFRVVIYGKLPHGSAVDTIDMDSMAEKFTFEPIQEKTIIDTEVVA